MVVLDNLGIQTATVEGVECIRLKDFARVIGKAIPTVHNLINRGNAVRTLKTVAFGDKHLIPIEEITKFPFTTVGRDSEIYYYKEDGSTTLEGKRCEKK